MAIQQINLGSYANDGTGAVTNAFGHVPAVMKCRK